MELNSESPHYTPKPSEFHNFVRYTSLRLANLRYHPRAQDHFDSISAVNKERKRHYKHTNWWIIHPFSPIRFVWEIIMTSVYGASFLVIPFMTSFIVFDYDDVRLDHMSLIFYVFFWIDIALNCITGVYIKEHRSFSFKQGTILKTYFSSFLMIDVLTSLPYDHFTHRWRTVPGPGSSVLIAVLNLTPILKICRYPTFNAYLSQLFRYFQMKDYTFRMTSTLILSFYVVFWSSCAFYLTVIIIMYIQQVHVIDCSCWLARVKTEGIADRFHNSLFIVLQNFVSSGFGGLAPESVGHMLISTIFMILGRIFEAYIIIMFLQIRRDKRGPKSKYEETMNQISAYTRQKQLPKYLKRRLEAYYHYRFRNCYFREDRILSSLSSRLREEIILHSCKRLVENVILFQNLPNEIITAIVSNLKFELYLPNDVIAKAGTHGDCMYFLSSGTVAVYTPIGQEVCHLESGAHFGEIALLIQGQRRIGTVIAIEVCEVYKLERRNFRKCIATHTELYERIEEMATERMDRTIMIEEQHKRFPIF